MRNLVSLAVASLFLLPAFGARADGPVSGDEARSGSPGGEVSPDRPVPAVPTVTITFERINDDLDDDFKIGFKWSEDVNGFLVDDIAWENLTPNSSLTLVGADSAHINVVTRTEWEGSVTVTVRAGAVTSVSTNEENESAQASREVDTKAPSVESATANVQTIVLIYHEEVDKNPNGNPPAGQYEVTTGRVDDGTNLNRAVPGSVYLDDERVTLTLAASDTIHPGDTVKLTYSASSNPLQDSTGNPAGVLTDTIIENLRKITKPGPVRNLTAMVTDTTIKLDWDQPSDTGGVPILDYRVQARKDGGTYRTLEWAPSQDSSMATEYLHDTLSTGETWTYLVAARNAAGEGDAAEITARTRDPKPGPPRNLTARADGTTAIDLSWTVPADTGTSAVTGYRIEVSTNAGRNWSDLVTDTKSTATTYEHTGLSAGTTRHYQVSAINGSGTGVPSDTAAATTRSGEPTPPRNLSATADGQTVIDLDWDAPADTGTSRVLSYRIEESSNGTAWTNLASTDSLTTAYERTGLSAGTKRHYRVFAINATGASEASNTDSATTESSGEPPDPPRNLEATADGQTTIDLDWDAPADTGTSRILSYKIEESNNGADWDSIAGTDSLTTAYERTGLSAGDTRHYRVFAVNATGASDASDTDSATTSSTPPRAPGPPTNLEATADGTNAIDLDWTAPSDTGSSPITGYKIEASEDDTTNWRVIERDTGSRTTAYEHSGLDPGDTYYYRVSAINGAGTSDPSDIDNATTESELPSAPRDLSATAADSTQIDLAWNPPDDDGGSPVTGYRIEMSPNGTSGWSDLDANTGSDDTFYSDTTLSPNTTRHYRVSAINDAGTGPASNVANATTSGTVPGQPTNLAASARDTSRIDLVWRAPSNDGGSAITGYRIEVSDDGRSWVDLERDTESDDTDYTHTNLAPGSLRYYRVSAINSAGTGNPSRLTFATTLDVPGEPTDLAATANGQTRIDLAWTRPNDDGGSPIEGYQIDVSENGGATWSVLVENSRSTTTGFSHTGLSAGDTRYYRVRAINEWGKGTYSLPANATTDATVPGPPLNLVADANGKTQIVIDWNPPDEDGGAAVTGYRIEVSANGTTWSDLRSNTGSTRTLFTHQNLDPGSTRHYRVAAINSVGVGDPSNVDSATTAPDVPDAPANLSAVANGTSRIDLTWDAPADDGGSDISGYRIEVSDNGTAWRTLRSNTQSDATEYSHTGLDPGTTQHYRVSAMNDAGTGEPSDAATATTDATFPDPPTGLSAAADGQTRIDLSWTAPADDGGAAVTGYHIEVSADNADTWTVLVGNTGSSGTNFTHTGLQPGTTRHYRVSAINAAGTGLPSNVANATTNATVPDPPTGLKATANGISRIDLDWKAPADDGGAEVTGYRIEVSVTRGVTWTTLVTDTDNTSTAYSHTGLPPATRRDYRVSAINRVGAGDPSNTAEATTDPDLPDPPTGLTADARGATTIDLSWTEPQYKGGVDITGYRIEVSEDEGATWTVHVGDTDSDDTDYAHTGLEPASTRHYRVSAINVAGLSDPSNVAGATTDPIVPDAPTDLRAEANGTSRIDLSWTAPGYDGGAAISGYRIEVSVDGGVVWRNLVADTRTTRTHYSHTGLDPATTRHYRVSAINRAGVGEASNEAGATTDATVPNAPTRLRATADGTSQIDLAWSAPGFDGGATITGYRIEVSEDAGSTWTDLVANTGSTDTGHSHTDLRPASTRHYRVSAINEIGRSVASNVASATTDATVPDPPTNLVATASSPTRIDLIWAAPEYDGGAPVTSYRVEVSEDGASWGDLARSTGSTATTFSHVGLQPGSTRHYRVSAINVAGTGMPSGVATASTDDPIQRAGRVNEAILPHFAAAATSSTMGAISARIEAVAARNPLQSQLKAAGLASLVGNLRGGRGDVNLARLFNGASFVMPLGADAPQQEPGEGFGAATWGSAEYFNMGEPGGEEVEWEGGMISLHLGADMRVHRDFLAGMSASRSSGDYDFTDVTGARQVEGTYEARMNSVNPYLAWLPGRTGVAVWAVGSFGWGEVAVDDEVAGRRESDARTTAGALGASRILVANGASALRIRTEGWLSQVKVDESEGMDSLTLDMQRGRFALEWSQVHRFRSGDEVTVLLEGGARFGDGEGTDGAGMEFGGGLRYSSPTTGLTMEGHGRLLATGDSGYEEWGVRGMIQIDPQAGKGLSVKLVPAWGDAASGVQELWERGLSGRRGGAAGMQRGRLNAELEYGLAGFHGTPYSRVYLVDGGTRAFGTGMRYDVSQVLGVRIEGTRTQSADAPARHGLALKGHLKF